MTPSMAHVRVAAVLAAALLALALPARADHGDPRPETGLGPYAYGTSSRIACETNVCVHWVEETEDAPPLEDADADAVPDRVEEVRDAFGEVWGIEVTADGFAAPPSDGFLGGDGRVDVYLRNQSTFGTVIPDHPGENVSSTYALLDDDFLDVIPGVEPGDETLRDTAAHEFFHMIQCGYDCLTDSMIKEGTAVWMSDRA